jgi:hypothetical protein
MDSLFQLILGIASTVAMIAVTHYLYLGTSKPTELVSFLKELEKTKAFYVYYAFVLIGWCTVTYVGSKTLLFWIPSSWGGMNENGNYVTAKDSFAITLAFFSTKLLINIANLARKKNPEPNQPGDDNSE